MSLLDEAIERANKNWQGEPIDVIRADALLFAGKMRKDTQTYFIYVYDDRYGQEAALHLPPMRVEFAYAVPST